MTRQPRHLEGRCPLFQFDSHPIFRRIISLEIFFLWSSRISKAWCKTAQIFLTTMMTRSNKEVYIIHDILLPSLTYTRLHIKASHLRAFVNERCEKLSVACTWLVYTKRILLESEVLYRFIFDFVRRKSTDSIEGGNFSLRKGIIWSNN